MTVLAAALAGFLALPAGSEPDVVGIFMTFSGTYEGLARFGEIADEQYGFLPGPPEGPCVMEVHELERTRLEPLRWGRPHLRIRATYDGDGRLVESERWDVFRQFDYRRRITWAGDEIVRVEELREPGAPAPRSVHERVVETGGSRLRLDQTEDAQGSPLERTFHDEAGHVARRDVHERDGDRLRGWTATSFARDGSTRHVQACALRPSGEVAATRNESFEPGRAYRRRTVRSYEPAEPGAWTEMVESSVTEAGELVPAVKLVRTITPLEPQGGAGEG